MAIFHLTAKVISRGKGQSAIAAAAYRSGERLRDEQANEQKFYEARAERIQFTAIMAPKDAPEWSYDRNQLWNEVERGEKRKDAQLAREIEIALPHEMTDEQRQWLAKDFAREAFVRKGYAVDIAIHAPDPDSDSRNYHAHLMVTMRTLGPDGFAPKKDPAMNSRAQLGEWREQFANLANRHLERHGHEARVDHRSLEAQGIDREPTVHVGYAGMEMAARGAQSDRMDALKDVLARNELRFEIEALAGARALLEAEEAARLQQQAPGADNPLDWTHRGGMVAQQASAMATLKRNVQHGAPAGNEPTIGPEPGKSPPEQGSPSNGPFTAKEMLDMLSEQQEPKSGSPPFTAKEMLDILNADTRGKDVAPGQEKDPSRDLTRGGRGRTR
jgi:hypothetical protein